MMHRAAFTSLRVWVSAIWRCWLYEKTDAGWLFMALLVWALLVEACLVSC